MGRRDDDELEEVPGVPLGSTEDDEEDGGWMTHRDDSSDLWDSTDDEEDLDDSDEDEPDGEL